MILGSGGYAGSPFLQMGQPMQSTIMGIPQGLLGASRPTGNMPGTPALNPAQLQASPSLMDMISKSGATNPQNLGWLQKLIQQAMNPSPQTQAANALIATGGAESPQNTGGLQPAISPQGTPATGATGVTGDQFGPYAQSPPIVPSTPAISPTASVMQDTSVASLPLDFWGAYGYS